ncbi:MAG: MFS transporter [Phycisphaerales bacterium JB054]
MTTPALPANQPAAALPTGDNVPARRERLTTILGAHTVTDFFSFLFIPILSVLEGRLDMTPRQGAIILSTGAVCSGLIQPLVAWLGDRFDTRMLSPLSLATAVICISLVGQASNFWHLLVIQIIGTAGIGAFHPAAAAAVGQLSGRKRSLGVSLFFFTGMAGGVLGNNLSPFMQRQFGLPNYIWLVIPGLLTALALAWAIRRVPHRHHTAAAQHQSWSQEESRARWFAIGVLYTGNVLRFTVNMMLVQLVIRWTEHAVLVREAAAQLTPALRESAAQLNGPMQGAMQIGMAGGGLMAGAFLRTHHEKAAIVAVPIVGALAVLAFPYTPGAVESLNIVSMLMPAAFVLAIATGVGYAGVVPVTIALAQRLLPHRTALASGLMLGGAWGIAAIGPPIAQMLINALGLTPAFAITAALLAVAGLMSLALPSKLLSRVSPH